MNILGLSGSTHDSSAALVVNGKVVNVIEEERICRVKKAPYSFPINAARVSMREADLRREDIDVVAYFISPDTFDAGVYRHLFSDWKRYLLHPIEYRTKNFVGRGKRYRDEAARILKELGIKAPVKFVNHHLSHAATAFYLSPFEESMILTIDNMGELTSTMLAHGNETKITVLGEQEIPHSIGMLYATITDYLGFRPWFDEGKVMAMAAYGTPSIPVEDMISFGDGKFQVRRPYQMVETSDHSRLYSDGLVRKLGPPRMSNEQITQRHKDIAASLQNATEETAKYLVTWLHEKTGSRRLCLAGGVALNCKMNGILAELPFVDEIYVAPASGDNGSGLGAAIYIHAEETALRPAPLLAAGIGRSFTPVRIENAIRRYGFDYNFVEDPAQPAAERLKAERIIAWYEGRSELGPRALGHRSILGVPGSEETRDYINTHVKGRELWRPLCPSILGTEVEKYFPSGSNSRFMNIAYRSSNDLKEKLPAIFHVDGTARIQAAYGEESDTYTRLLANIGNETGYPILINTSFNLKGEPIVDSPEDALSTFSRMPLKTMVMGNYFVRKR